MIPASQQCHRREPDQSESDDDAALTHTKGLQFWRDSAAADWTSSMMRPRLHRQTDSPGVRQCHSGCKTRISGCRLQRHVDEDDDAGSAAADQRYTAGTELVQGPNPVELCEVPPTAVNWSLIIRRTPYGRSGTKRTS